MQPQLKKENRLSRPTNVILWRQLTRSSLTCFVRRACVRVYAPAAGWNTEAFLSVSNMWEQLITVSNHAWNLFPSFFSILRLLRVKSHICIYVNLKLKDMRMPKCLINPFKNTARPFRQSDPCILQFLYRKCA